MLSTGISVECEASKGTFVSEYFVKIKTSNDSMWEGAVDKEMVFNLAEGESTQESYVKGRMYAYLISYNNGLSLIELPIEDSTAGRRIFVSTDIVRKEKIPA